MSTVSEMPTATAAVNPTTSETPVASVKDRLAHALETAESLAFDARCLGLDVSALLTGLKEIAERPATRGNTAVHAAIDSTEWVHHALENVDDEFETLIAHLSDASET
jgi:hypothetical protein